MVEEARFDASRRGIKRWILVSTKVKARTVVGRGEEGPLCDPGSLKTIGRERESSARIAKMR